MLDDPRLDQIAQAIRRRDGEAAPLLIGLMLAEEAGESLQQLRRLLGHARRSTLPTTGETNSQTSSSAWPYWRGCLGPTYLDTSIGGSPKVSAERSAG
jgi:hypothetical protein